MDGQLGLDGMPARLFSCTPSRLGTWLDCPRRYRMTYLDRPSPPKGGPWAHSAVGAAVHLALARWWSLPRRTPETARALVDQAWPGSPHVAGFRDDVQSERWRARAGDMVQAYAATLDPDDEPVGVERTVATRTATLAVSGRVDRIDRRTTAAGEEVVVVDYKAGRWVPDTADARGSLALALYVHGARRTLRRACSTVELHHLPSGTTVSWTHTEESLSRHLSRAEDIAAEAGAATAALAAGDDGERAFPATPGPMCSWCDVAQHCPEGLAAAPRKRSWEGLAEEV